MKKITTPLTKTIRRKLKCGQEVLLSGTIYTARDAAHKRLAEFITAKKKLPFDIKGAIIYYTGPTPKRSGSSLGSCGPTTSSRMDRFTPALLKAGLEGMIGKGKRTAPVRKAVRRYEAIYFLTIGGAGAYLAKRIKKAEVLAFKGLGPEAIYKLEVKDFPLIVGIDSRGKDIYPALSESQKFSRSRKGGVYG